MLYGMTETKLRDVARREHAAALDDYCSTMKSIAHALDRCEEPAPDLVERAQAAKLRLENARTLLQFSVDMVMGATPGATRRRRVH